MTTRLGLVLLTVAACGPAAPAGTLGNHGTGASLDVRAVAFGVGKHGGVLAAHALPVAKAAALIATVPEDGRGDIHGGMPDPTDTSETAARILAFDLDGDGRADLVEFSEVMYGPSSGWQVYTRAGDKLEHAFGISGNWADEHDDDGGVTLRFEASILAPGEALFSTTLHYDRATHAWSAPIKSYGPSPAPSFVVKLPLAPFHGHAAITVRAAPAVVDGPMPADDAPMTDDGFDKSATLGGNVIARYAAGAFGVEVSGDSEWRYVAFDPTVKPTMTSLGHGMDAESMAVASEDTRHTLQSHAWICGWVKASEIR